MSSKKREQEESLQKLSLLDDTKIVIDLQCSQFAQLIEWERDPDLLQRGTAPR